MPSPEPEGLRRRLRRRLQQGPILIAPGAYDGLTARMVEKAGFDAVYFSGAGLSYSLLARQDVGLLTMTEMAERARYVAGAVGIPVIADADTGYGDEENIGRTVRAYEAAGVAAMQIEDQEHPKRCGHLAGKRLVPVEEMVARIRAAVSSRSSPDLLVIARTDGRAVEGLDRALERASRYREEGADVLFLEAPQSVAELEQIGLALEGPLMANMVEGGKTPLVPAQQLESWGYRLVIFPNSMTRLFARAGLELLKGLKEEGTTSSWLGRMMSFSELNALLEEGRDGR